MNTPRLFARPQTESFGWNSELALRYGAAALVTLIALAAAQLVLPTKMMLVLGGITLLGVPVSLWMRLHQMRLGGWRVPRPLWNALTVMASFAASALFLRVPLINMLAALRGGFDDAAILRIGATEPMLLLVQLFLIFAAFRSFSLISDKDATLATVPSFSVLLLLIPVYPNIEVVCYFIVWTLVATMLFALDHRSEIHAQARATVPAPAPGQEVKLAARNLAGVLAISLTVAVTLSGLLTARDPREGSSTDSAISLLSSRLTRLSLQTSDGSTANGPQRQIDFSTGTSLPTRAKLWKVTSVTTEEGKSIIPIYWRLFTLSDYNGSTWSQNSESARSVDRTSLTLEQMPRRNYFQSGDGRGSLRAPDRRENSNSLSNSRRPSFGIRGGRDFRDGNFRRRSFEGFAISGAYPASQKSFGFPRQRVRYHLEAARTSLGFIPLLPAPMSLASSNSEQNSTQNAVRVRADGGVDLSIVNAGQSFWADSQVPAAPEYGIAGAGAPLQKPALKRQSNPNAPTLSAVERAADLALPSGLPARVRQFARDNTRALSAQSSDFARARALASATQKGAIYTLRPPSIPNGRDATDFFLFDSRRGYCTYFAGALTVLCRAQGIPARVVSGFVAPDNDGQGNLIIRDANAHAWTEVWVEGYGWAVVDATPPDDRGDNAPTLLEDWSDLAAASLDGALRWSFAHWPVVLSGALLLLLIFGLWRFRPAIRRRLGHALVEDVETVRRQIADDYARAARDVARRFRPRQQWETPDEWLRAARTATPQLPFEPLQTLTALYVRAHFSPLNLNSDDARHARQARAQAVWPNRK